MSALDQSVLVSSGVTVTAASLVPSINWALNGFHGTPPDSLAPIIAGIIVALVHAVLNVINNAGKKSAEADEPPPPDAATQRPAPIDVPANSIPQLVVPAQAAVPGTGYQPAAPAAPTVVAPPKAP